MDLGWETNCLPAARPALLALVVAAYSDGESALMAEEGRYLSPVACGPCVEGLPLFVRHFCSVQDFRLFCDFFKLIPSFSLFDLPKVLRCCNQPFKYISVGIPVVDGTFNPCIRLRPFCTEMPVAALYEPTTAQALRLFHQP